MKNKHILIMLLATALLFGSTACHKDAQIEPKTPKVTEPDVSFTATTADFGWAVSFPGKVSSVVKVSRHVDMSDATSYGDATPTSNKDFHVEITGLSPETQYYYCFEIWNPNLNQRSEVKSFTTQALQKPTVTTASVSEFNFTNATAVGGGEVTSDGEDAVTERGIYFGTTPNPAITGTKLVASSTGTGSFTCTMTGLVEGTTYYVCAYATNSLGTGYGTEVSFTTPVDRIFTVNGVSFTMKRAGGGTFWMGAQSTNSSGQNYDSEAYDSESPVHSVTLSTFYMGETEVTQELWQAVMGSNPSHFSGTNLPVEMVSWNMIVNQFLPALNAATGQNFRLPTEAEWEYAARGGNQGHGYKYAGSNTIGDVAWYTGNSNSQTHAVATKQPNELGLYDMSGNVWEWCSDWYGNYNSGSQNNPQGPSSGSTRVLRGGGWLNSAGCCRVSYRYSSDPDDTNYNYGFRLALPQ